MKIAEKLQEYLLVLPDLRIEIVEYKHSDTSGTLNAIIAAIQHRLSVPEIKTIVIHPAWVLLNHSAFPFQEHPNKDYCSTEMKNVAFEAHGGFPQMKLQIAGAKKHRIIARGRDVPDNLPRPND